MNLEEWSTLQIILGSSVIIVLIFLPTIIEEWLDDRYYKSDAYKALLIKKTVRRRIV